MDALDMVVVKIKQVAVVEVAASHPMGLYLKVALALCIKAELTYAGVS